MDEANPTIISTTDAESVQGSSSDLAQNEIDVLKQELADVKEQLHSLAMMVENLTGVKVETAPAAIPPTKIEVKNEPVELEVWHSPETTPVPVQQGDLDNEQPDVEREEIEYIEVGDEPEITFRDANNGGEQAAIAPPRRQSTEEPVWATPPHRKVNFRLDPGYARRIGSTNEAAAGPSRVPALAPRTREETPPPPLCSPSPPPTVAHPTNPIGVTHTSPPKRKYTFELVIGVPSKRFKASLYSASTASSDGPTACSSHDVLGGSMEVVTGSSVRKRRSDRVAEQDIRRIRGIPFKVALDPQIRDVLVSRSFIRMHFGARGTRSYTEPARHRVEKHGYDHFVLLSELEPYQAPSAPGQPGLTTLFKENMWPARELYRIFARTKAPPAGWQYMGLYRATKLPAWSPAEVGQQPPAVRAWWEQRIRASVWGRPIIARVMLREQLDREPTVAEVNSQVDKLKDGSVGLPPLGIIRAAFEAGDEKIYPWKLECKGYEEELQWEMSLTFPYYQEGCRKKKNA